MLEVFISLGLLGLLLSGIYIFYANVLQARKTADRIVADVQLYRITLDRIADDIRNAAGFAPGFGVGLQGRHDEVARTDVLTIFRYVLPGNDVFNEYDLMSDQLPPAKADLRRVEYRLVVDDENLDEQGEPVVHGLLRTEQKTLNQLVIVEGRSGSALPQDNPLERPDDREGLDQEQEVMPADEGLESELMAPEIKYLKIEYYDGASWVKDWVGMSSQGNVLPQAVRVTIGRTPISTEEEEYDLNLQGPLDEEKRMELQEEHPDRFSIVVRLKQADRFLNSRVASAKKAAEMGTLDTALRDQSDDMRRSLRSVGGGLGRESR